MSRNILLHENSKKSMIGLCTSSLPKTFHATAAGTVIGTWKASLKVSYAGILYIWVCCVLTIFASKIVAASSQKLANPLQHSLSQSQ